MPAGYAPTSQDILNYYGRSDVQRELFDFSRDRRLIFNDEGLDSRVFHDARFRRIAEEPGDFYRIVRSSIRTSKGDRRPETYPAFHGTQSRFLNPSARSGRYGCDLVIDIESKESFRRAKAATFGVVERLGSFEVPFALKFTGGTSFHLIIPHEKLCQRIGGVRPSDSFSQFANACFDLLSRDLRHSGRGIYIDGSFCDQRHFFRLPYSINENTGLVSLPLRAEELRDFEMAQAKMGNCEVLEGWWECATDSSRTLEGLVMGGMKLEGMRRARTKGRLGGEGDLAERVLEALSVKMPKEVWIPPMPRIQPVPRMGDPGGHTGGMPIEVGGEGFKGLALYLQSMNGDISVVTEDIGDMLCRGLASPGRMMTLREEGKGAIKNLTVYAEMSGIDLALNSSGRYSYSGKVKTTTGNVNTGKLGDVPHDFFMIDTLSGKIGLDLSGRNERSQRKVVASSTFGAISVKLDTKPETGYVIDAHDGRGTVVCRLSRNRVVRRDVSQTHVIIETEDVARVECRYELSLSTMTAPIFIAD
jgi:hypothetical protein